MITKEVSTLILNFMIPGTRALALGRDHIRHVLKIHTVESFKVVGKSNFGSWERYFMGKLYDVTREDSSYLIFFYKPRK